MLRPPPEGSIRRCRLYIASDARRYGSDWRKSRGFWTTAAYRLARTIKLGRPACKLLLPVYFLVRLKRNSDTELPATVRAGPGLHLPHPQGVIIGADCRIGVGVSIFQQVTLGNWTGGQPRIASRAVIFAGAKIVGGVTVGRRAFVGANAAVIADVPPWHNAVGVPAKMLRRTDQPEAATTAFLPTQT